MRKKLILLLPLILIMFILNACAKKPATSATPSESKTVSLSCDSLTGEKQKACRIAVDQLIGEMLATEISDTFNIERCKELDEGQAEDCRRKIQLSGIKSALSSEKAEKLKNLLNFSTFDFNQEEPLKEEDKRKFQKLCGTLERQDIKTYCVKKITQRAEEAILQRAINSGNMGQCDNLLSQENKMACKEAISPPDQKSNPQASEEETFAQEKERISDESGEVTIFQEGG